MKITEYTPIHYFLKDESRNDFHSIRMEAYLEIPQGGDESSFRQIESMRLFISTDMENHESITFDYTGGRNQIMHHWAKNIDELVQRQESDHDIYRFKKVEQEEYLQLRKKAFDIYLSHDRTDYTRLEIGSEFKL